MCWTMCQDITLIFLQASSSNFTCHLIPTTRRFSHAFWPTLPFLISAVTISSEFGKSQRAVENREKWRKLVAKSSVVPKWPSLLRDWWWWWWWCSDHKIISTDTSALPIFPVLVASLYQTSVSLQQWWVLVSVAQWLACWAHILWVKGSNLAYPAPLYNRSTRMKLGTFY